MGRGGGENLYPPLVMASGHQRLEPEPIAPADGQRHPPISRRRKPQTPRTMAPIDSPVFSTDTSHSLPDSRVKPVKSLDGLGCYLRSIVCCFCPPCCRAKWGWRLTLPRQPQVPHSKLGFWNMSTKLSPQAQEYTISEFADNWYGYQSPCLVALITKSSSMQVLPPHKMNVDRFCEY